MRTVNKELHIIHNELVNDKTKYLFFYGSRGSGKSTTACNFIIVHAIDYPGSKILVARKSFPSLRMSVLKLFKEQYVKYSKEFPVIENKTNSEFYFNGSTVSFTSLYLSSGEKNERLKSTEWDWIWLEEATELDYEDVNDLIVGTLRGKVGWRQAIFTFNPPRRKSHWIYKLYNENINEAKKVHFFYKDNPALPKDYVANLEGLKEKNQELYRRYTLGEWEVDVSDGLIYTNIEQSNLEIGENLIGGVDFGFNNPSVFLLTSIDEDIQVHRELYEIGLTNRQFGEKIINLLNELNINLHIPIYADSSEPARIQELYNMGLRGIKPADKSVVDGIDEVKRYKVLVDYESPNTWSEIKSYEWCKDKNGNILDVPVKFNDHCMDALRYAVYTYKKEYKPYKFGVINIGGYG